MEINRKQIIDFIIATSIISITLFPAIAILVESNTQNTNTIPLLGSEKDSWTLMIYLDGDNNFCKYAQQELDEIRRVQVQNDVTIVVLFDERGENNTHCYVFGKETMEMSRDILRHSWENEVNMGDSGTLQNFILYCMENYPAHHYLLELWGHGSGLKGMCSDETSCDRLSVQEIVSALKKAGEEHNHAIDILVLTACYMGEIECIQKLQNTAKYIIASGDEVPASGLPHTMILNSLMENPHTLPDKFSVEIIETYHDHYRFTSESLTLFLG